MNILAIESSCDDLSFAVVKDGREVLALEVATQEEIHAQTGGVVPEVAAREHLRTLRSTLDAVMQQVEWEQIDVIAYTQGPGLLGSLLVGTVAAQALATYTGKPLLPVHHIEGHIASLWLERESIPFPMVVLTVSGGHNDVYYMEKFGAFQHLGGTLDDAAGAAFDKVSRMLGLGYPGGPAIEKFLTSHNAFGCSRGVMELPRAWGKKDETSFSFSGLKSEVRRRVEAAGKDLGHRVQGLAQESNPLSTEDALLIADAFVESVVDVLCRKTFLAAQKVGATSVCVTGGVSASTPLREHFMAEADAYGYTREQVFFPTKRLYCTDNAAMIGAAAFFILQEAPERLLTEASEFSQIAPHSTYVL